MRILLGFFFVSILSIFSCQKEEQQHVQIKYHKLIYNAEKLLIEDDINQAFNCYTQAIKLPCKVFAKDYYNMVLSGVKINKNVDTPISKLLELGISIEYLKANEAIRDYLDEPKVKELRASSLQNVVRNDSLRLILDSMFYYDQKWRNLDLSLDSTGYNNYNKQIDSIDQVNGLKFLEIVEQYGFPSEDDLGFNDSFPIPLRYNF
ncbi:MAG: hypothetical protein AAGJ18_27680, partial [Bacteroidota bacterium]